MNYWRARNGLKSIGNHVKSTFGATGYCLIAVRGTRLERFRLIDNLHTANSFVLIRQSNRVVAQGNVIIFRDINLKLPSE